MIHITKKEVNSFGELINTKWDKFNDCGIFYYHGKPMSRWLMFRFQFAFWWMKTFRLFKLPIDNGAK